jgi:hypothetical protein
MNRIKKTAVFICLITLCAMAVSGCGKKQEENTVTDTANNSKEAVAEAPKELTTEEKRAKFEELYRENAVLFNDYNDILQEIAYYESVYHQDIADKYEFKTAEEKLNETRQDRPLRYRPIKEFHTEVGEIVIPDVSDSELDKWIDDLTGQNATIKEQTELLIPKRNTVKDQYGVVMNLDGITIAKEDADKTSTSDDSKSQTDQAVSADGTVEDIFKAGGWNIAGSEDSIEATKVFGDDEFYYSSKDLGETVYLNVEIRSISYGELSGMTVVTDAENARKVAAIVVNGDFNGAMNYPLDWNFYNGG